MVWMETRDIWCIVIRRAAAWDYQGSLLALGGQYLRALQRAQRGRILPWQPPAHHQREYRVRPEVTQHNSYFKYKKYVENQKKRHILKSSLSFIHFNNPTCFQRNGVLLVMCFEYNRDDVMFPVTDATRSLAAYACLPNNSICKTSASPLWVTFTLNQLLSTLI